uniref:Ig-like domain-containing protein n=1 Tax=Leptobrachium leishanense TaxID=445787 RepID=A0A8C5R677_9ANUR
TFLLTYFLWFHVFINNNLKVCLSFFPASPTFEVHHQNFSIGENQTLVCRVLGFDPPRIVVKWFLNGTHEEIDRVRRLGASEVVSYYNFTPTCQHRGVNISCWVEHDTLPAPTTWSSGAKDTPSFVLK